MKIGLLTIHHSYNYGAALQVYAMYDVLREYGFPVEIIDYDNSTFLDERKLYLAPNSIGNILRDVRALLKQPQYKKRIDRFEEFYLLTKKSTKHWINHCDLSNEGYDVVITGSDQTFCLYLTNKPAEMRPYFLEYVGKAKRVSYASSMGERFAMITESDEKWLRERFLSYECLTVRENRSADYIERLIGRRPEVVLDPTLLSTVDKWNEVAVDYPIQGEYIVFYTVLSDSWVINFVEQLSKLLKIKVVAIHAQTRYELHAKYEFINDIGPREFISIIKNAKFVVTTSFHATAFSILFKKQFVSLVIGEGNRINTLLANLHLSERAVRETTDESLKRTAEEIMYDPVEKELEKLRVSSLTFLIEAIGMID